MTHEQTIWVTVYAAVLQGLASNPEVRLRWEDLRSRAAVEAHAAVRQIHEGVA